MLAGLLSACSSGTGLVQSRNMGPLIVERIGGLAGYGGPGARLRSIGKIEFERLSPADQKTMESLFESRGGQFPSPVRDGFRYRITRNAKSATETIEVAEELLPAAVSGCVRDELR